MTNENVAQKDLSLEGNKTVWGKRENACNHQFLLFSHGFCKPSCLVIDSLTLSHTSPAFTCLQYKSLKPLW